MHLLDCFAEFYLHGSMGLFYVVFFWADSCLWFSLSLHLYWELEPESSSFSSSSSSPPCGVKGSGPDRVSSAAPLRLWSRSGYWEIKSFSFSSSESAEMSAVIPEQVRSEQGSCSGADPEQPEAGVLQPQTVFVILDPAETLNVVRWVRKFFFCFFFTPLLVPRGEAPGLKSMVLTHNKRIMSVKETAGRAQACSFPPYTHDLCCKQVTV